jgi:hypothetical protein
MLRIYIHTKTGRNTNNDNIEKLILICQGMDKIKIVGESSRFLIKNVSGHIYTFGKILNNGSLGFKGGKKIQHKLGYNTNVYFKNEYVPRKIDIHHNIIQMCPGFTQTLLLTDKGKIYYTSYN